VFDDFQFIIHYLLFVFYRCSSVRYRSGVGFACPTNYVVIMDTVKKQLKNHP
jgi:hypothetical protein